MRGHTLTRLSRARAAARAWLCAAAVAAAAPGAAATHCCSDPAGFRYEPLPAEGSVDLTIDSHSATFEFQSGPSAFRAFVLPPATRPYLIEVRSFLRGGPDPRRARVFYPVVAVLTDDFLVSRSTDLEALRFDLPLLEQSTAPAYRVVLAIDPSNPHERYLVVFTPSQLREGRSLPPVATPEAAAEVAKMAFLGAAPYGRLRITLKPGATGPATTEPPAR
jgi:hypothetical protein